MAGFALGPAEQVAQIAFRMDLAESWHLQPGMRVLEIGCGQGDMTVFLAEAVGAEGRVVAVDAASEKYGAPVSLGDSAEKLKRGPLGDRIDFQFEFDAHTGIDLLEGQFDVAVMALCTWYFSSLDEITHILQGLRRFTSRLCLAEWNMAPDRPEQLGHFLSVLVQGQIEARRRGGQGNVRTPYSRLKLDTMLRESGWTVESSRTVEAAGLADARWERAACLADSLDAAKQECFSEKEMEFLESQLDVLRELDGDMCMPAYSVVAHR